MDTKPVEVLSVDGIRLWNRLMEMAMVAPTDNGGSNRQALSDDDAAGRALLLGWATAAGFTAETDEIGNLWIRRPGADPSAPTRHPAKTFTVSPTSFIISRRRS